MSNKVLICDKCHSKDCAAGDLFCEEYRTAGFLEVTEEEYNKLREEYKQTLVDQKANEA